MPKIAVRRGRSWNATEIGNRKNTGSSADVAPPETRHSATTAVTSATVDAQSAHAERVRTRTKISHDRGDRRIPPSSTA